MSSAPPKKKLRSDNKIYLIGNMEHQIVGAKLPSKLQVLQVFFYNKRVIGLDTNTSARLVFDEVSLFWQKARIPTSAEWYCTQKVKQLYEEWASLQKNSSRKSASNKSAEEIFIDQLDELFDIAASDALKTMKIHDDKLFLIAQRKKGREGCLLGIDQKGQEKEEKRQERIDKEEMRRKTAEMEKQKYEQGMDMFHKFRNQLREEILFNSSLRYLIGT